MSKRRLVDAPRSRPKRTTAKAEGDGVFVYMSAQVLAADRKIVTRLQMGPRHRLCEQANMVLVPEAASVPPDSDELGRMTQMLSSEPTELYDELVCMVVGPVNTQRARALKSVWESAPDQERKRKDKRQLRTVSIVGIVGRGIKLAQEARVDTYVDMPLVYALHQFGRREPRKAVSAAK